MGRRFTPKASGGAKAAAEPAKKKNPADLDIIGCDSEFSEVLTEDREIQGETKEVWLRCGALWKGLPKKDGSGDGPALVLLGREGEERVAGKLFLEKEGDEGALYTLRMVEGKGQDQRPVKGQEGKLAEVFWPTGRQPQFEFSERGQEILGGVTHAKGIARKAKD